MEHASFDSLDPPRGEREFTLLTTIQRTVLREGVINYKVPDLEYRVPIGAHLSPNQDSMTESVNFRSRFGSYVSSLDYRVPIRIVCISQSGYRDITVSMSIYTCTYLSHVEAVDQARLALSSAKLILKNGFLPLNFVDYFCYFEGDGWWIRTLIWEAWCCG